MEAKALHSYYLTLPPTAEKLTVAAYTYNDAVRQVLGANLALTLLNSLPGYSISSSKTGQILGYITLRA